MVTCAVRPLLYGVNLHGLYFMEYVYAMQSLMSCLFKAGASEKNICNGEENSLSIQAMINKKRLQSCLFVCLFFSQNLSLCEIF